MRDAQARLGHPFPPCPHAPTAVAMLCPRAGMPGTLLPRQAPCQRTTLVPAWQCQDTLAASLPLTLPPRASVSPMPRAAARRFPRLSFLSPGKGRELPPPLPHIPQPSQETVTSSGCAEPAPDSWHQRGGWEPSPASSLLSPACVPPSPRAAAVPQRVRRGDTGTATQTPAFPCPPRCWIPGQQGHWERGKGTGQWHCWGQRGGHGTRGAMLPGMVPACRKCWQGAGHQAWPCPGDAQGPGSVPALAMPAGRPAGGSPAVPRRLVPTPATRQVPGMAKPLRPSALPGRGAHCVETRAKLGQGMGWGSRGQAGDGQPYVGWHQWHGAVGCCPPSHSLGCGEAQEEPSGEAGACCAPAVPCFPSYTAQLAGCLYRPELILAAPRFPLLPFPPAFPSPGARPPCTRHPSLTPSEGVAKQGHGWHMLCPVPYPLPAPPAVRASVSPAG